MASNISNILNNKLRMTGMSTGLDVEGMVQKLMSVERAKVDKVKQQKQLKEWQRDDYRSVTNLLRGFRDEYFDVLKPSTNFRSEGAFTATGATSSKPEILTATAGSGAVPGTYSIVVNSLATNAIKNGSTGISRGYNGITGSGTVDMTAMRQGKEFTITLDGIRKTIILDKDYSAYSEQTFATNNADPTLATDGLQKLLNDAFGKGKITVTGNNAGHTLTFRPATSSSTVSVSDSTNTYVASMGFASGQGNSVTSSSDITDFSGGNFTVQIDSGAEVNLTVASGATDTNSLLNNINAALVGAGLDINLQAVKDPDDPERIKFISIDTSRKVTIKAGTTNDLLAKAKVGSSVINPLSGTIDYSVSDIGKSFKISTYNPATSTKNTYTIDLQYNYTSDASTDANGRTLSQEIQQQLSAQGAAGFTVSISGGKLNITNTSGREIKLENGDAGLKEELGFASSQDSINRIGLGETLESLSTLNAAQAGLATPFNFGTDTKLTFRINTVTFSVDKSETLGSVIEKINNSEAGVKLRYDSLNDKFIMESKTTGASSVIDNTNNPDDAADNFFTALGIKTTAQETGGEPVRGTDASITLDSTNDGVDNGTLVTRSTNDFTASGLSISLKSFDAALTKVTVNVNANADDLVAKIKNFVNKYNEVVDTINKKLTDKRERAYQPLTDEQRDSMKEDDIKKWEEKAKTGLLRGDSILSSVADSMRKALYDNIYTDSADESSKLPQTLASIGITTSSYYQDRGKLVIDETKLRDAIAKTPDKVSQLFTKDDSGISYTDALNDKAKRAERYKESGLAQRLYDIIQDAIRTTRNNEGQKGALLEKAGMIGDISEFTSLLYKEIDQDNKKIDDINDRLIDKENKYYIKFSNLERMLSQMNAQGGWFAAQAGQ
ncbi:MAG: flagellar filament capping protein FliD [Clostridia bacterium]|nr:flagellar filament capping protein FliD [Clostridia bacterium]